MHILWPETDNCPWISRRERMTVENISWSISTKECCWPRRGLNPQTPGLQSDSASNWATEAGQKKKKKKMLSCCCPTLLYHWLSWQIAPDKRGYLKKKILISRWKHLLRVLIRSASSSFPFMNFGKAKIRDVLITKTKLFYILHYHSHSHAKGFGDPVCC